MHIVGKRNYEDNLLSRWRTLPSDATEGSVPLSRMAAFAVPNVNYVLPTKGVLGDRSVILMSGKVVEKTAPGPTRRVQHGQCRVR